MKKYMPLLLPLCLLWTYPFLYTTLSFAENAGSYNAEPPFAAVGAPPLVMLVMGRDHKLYFEAYNDHTDLDGDGNLEIHYKPSIDYYGYFDSYKYYQYNSALKRFEPKGYTTDKKAPSGDYWSGDFLNYLTMARIDVMRKVLYGGYRSTDSGTETVLEREYIPNDAHCWGKEYTDLVTDGYLISDYTPYAEPTAGNRHLFASGSVVAPSDSAYAPLLRVKLNSSNRISKWVTAESANGIIGTTLVGTPDADFHVRVQVGVTAYPDVQREKVYTNTATGAKVWKPIGILQRYGESGKMKFGLMSGSYQNNLSGGVLRKNIDFITDEINSQTGQFLYKSSSVGGIIKTIDNLTVIGFNHTSNYWDQTIYSRPINQGENYMWGNPIGEIMYETLRYFNGASPTPAFIASVSNNNDRGLALPLEGWKNPYAATTAGGLGNAVCAKPFMLVLSDINPSYDTNQLPGVDSSFADATPFAGTLGTFNAKDLADAIFAGEPSTAGSHYIGQSNALYDTACSAKTVTGLGTVRGLCPEEPTKMGGYYSAAAAYYGKTTDISVTATDVQNITTYAVALASPLPRIEIPMAFNTITLVPFAKTVYSTTGGGVDPAGTFQPTCAIVDFYVEEINATHGKFTVTYEHSEQGADYDLDATITYEYTKNVSTNQVTISITSENFPGGDSKQHFGYIISGTGSATDGVYLDIKNITQPDAGDKDYRLDTPNVVGALPNTKTRTFTASTASAASLLKDPLYYAAKWGAFDDKNNNKKPDLDEEWDKDQDGVPDTYFYVINPLLLETQLNKSFASILGTTKSGTSASVISGSRSGEGAVYQSVFYPEKRDLASGDNKITWAGSVHASFVDSLGRMREDTPDVITGAQNHILDKMDKVIVFKKDTGTGALSVEKYNLVDGVAEKTSVTLPAATPALAGKYFQLSAAGEKFYVWFTVAGIGTDPQPPDMTGIKVALSAGDSDITVATSTASAIANLSYTFSVARTTNVITITNKTPGDSPDATVGTTGWTASAVSVTTQGTGETVDFDTLGSIESINYLWNTNTWLNSSAMDAGITSQRGCPVGGCTATDLISAFQTVGNKRWIFTFIDANKNMIADTNEQIPFVVGSSPPSLTDLTNENTLFPYIPVNSDSESLPAYVTDSTKRDAFLPTQTQRVINYIRGQDQDKNTTAISGVTIPAFRSRKLDLDKDKVLETTWRLGDIVYSSPTVVSKPQEALHLLYKDQTYATFADKYKQRRTVVYTGGNDGMMHAFNGGFYEDRFDVYPATADGVKDAEFLLQPKDKNQNLLSGYAGHALGSELWAYVPYNLLPHLYWLTEPDYAHVYYVDLKPRIFDAKIFPIDADHPGGWGTVLVGGMRFGGGKINIDMNRRDGNVSNDDRTMRSAFFVLDITNPEVPPTVLAEFNFPHLGYTTCYPTVATLKDTVEKTDGSSPNRWFLIFGSGPAEADGSPGTTSGVSLPNAVSDQKAELYIVDLVEMAKNKVLKTIGKDGTLATIPATLPNTDYFVRFDAVNKDNNAFISDPVTVDYNLDYKADAVYFGTESYDGSTWGGRLRRIVMKNDISPSNWIGDSTLIDLEKNSGDPVGGAYQPISAAPTVGLDPDGNFWVYFGTGRYFIRNDKDIIAQQTFYGIKEPRAVSGSDLVNSYTEVVRDNNTTPTTALYNSTNIEVDTNAQTVIGGPSPPSGTSSAPIPWKDFVMATKNYKGWYYNFTESLERNVGQAALFGNLATFTSYVPSPDTCKPEGSSNLYALYYATGTAANIPAIGTNILIDTKTYNRKKISLGTGLVSKPSVHVGEKDGSTAFVQSSDGSIITIDEANPGMTKSGRTAWSYKE